ncbi:MAG: glycosyltransferase [Actinomycetota bacterium]|nr:glycosyltransferase [Actinomycetota bacterium]
MDPLSSTVGSSQVFAYVERLARRGLGVDLVTFEHSVDLGLLEKLSVLGVDWRPQKFGRPGPVGGLGRVIRAAGVIRGAEIVHARSDLAAASVMLARIPYWVWDVRSLWVDQKIASGVVQSGSVQEKIMRWIERRAASKSTAVLTLTASAIEVLDELYRRQVSPKGHVVTTCTDLDHFSVSPLPPTPLRVLIAGTLNRYYDLPAMLDLVAELRRRRPVTLVVASPGVTDWEEQLATVEANRVSAASKEMKDLVSSCHVGLSICRDDAGISLLAAMPTKIGEFLASGRPVVVNPGLVEAAELVQSHRCGTVFGSSVSLTLVETANELETFLMDPRLPDRCRALAEGHFDLDRGVDQLVEVYRSVHPCWGP